MNIDPAKQREFAIEVVRRLREASFEAYWAGGCVRDQLLNRTPYDYDVATSAHPEEIRGVFRHRKTLSIGAAFGVMTVVGPGGAGHVEVATFRQDVSYSDGRHPDRIAFSSPEEDAKRRDFTINGMFYDPIDDKLVDFVGGQADLNRQIVRAIGDPRQRFTEDKLRMLRAIRFAAIFNFELDAETQAAIREMADQITVVSAERIAGEMRIMLVHPARARVLDLLNESQLLLALLPEVANLAAKKPWAGPLSQLTEPSFALAMAVLLTSASDQDISIGAKIGRRWHLANHEIDRLDWLLKNRTVLLDATKKKWSQLQPILAHEGAADLVAIYAVMPGTDPADVDFCRHQLRRQREELDPEPLITGNDLIELGVRPGPVFSTLLQLARDSQLNGHVRDRQSALALVRESLRSDSTH